MSASKQRPTRSVIGIGLLIVAVGLLGFGVYCVTVGRPNELEAKRAELNANILEAIKIGKSGQYKRAVVLLREIVDQNPQNIDALYNYGTALRATNDLETADKVFQRILSITPEDYEAWVERASLAVLRDDLEKAFDFLDKVPRGAGNLILRLRTDPKWQALSDHPRMKKVRAQQDLLRKFSY